jgi:ribosomal protein S18 acetylase RimI-like enzyme
VSHEVTIRPARVEDATVLARLSAQVQELHVHERPDIFKPVDVAGLESWFRNTLGAGQVSVWIAEAGSMVAGYALVVEQRRAPNVYCFERRWHEVEQIGVDLAYRRQGIARALLEHIADSAASEGVEEVELNTWSFNVVAHAAFQGLGFSTKNIRFARRTRP